MSVQVVCDANTSQRWHQGGHTSVSILPTCALVMLTAGGSSELHHVVAALSFQFTVL
jgi:hypothetical protein